MTTTDQPSKYKRINQMRKEFLNEYVLVKKDSDNTSTHEIKKINAIELYNHIGKQKMTRQSEYSMVGINASQMLEKMLAKEKEELKDGKITNENDFVRLRDLHNNASIKTYFKVMTLLYLFPIFFLFNSKMRNLSFVKYIFLIPLFAAYPIINDGVRQYTTRKQAILMLFCLDKNYKNIPEFYSLYDNFMKENHIEFKKI